MYTLIKCTSTTYTLVKCTTTYTLVKHTPTSYTLVKCTSTMYTIVSSVHNPYTHWCQVYIDNIIHWFQVYITHVHTSQVYNAHVQTVIKCTLSIDNVQCNVKCISTMSSMASSLHQPCTHCSHVYYDHVHTALKYI